MGKVWVTKQPHAAEPCRDAAAGQTPPTCCRAAVAQARAVLGELMLLKGPDGPSKAADIILKHLGCGNVRYGLVSHLQHTG